MPPYRILKRGLDVLVASIVFVLCAPFMVIITVLLWFYQGKVIFKQLRPGLHGKLFNIYKVSSMTDVCDQEGNPLPDEERLTRVGRFLRTTSLDEVPQLWNVLRGDMSLVGPRPLLVQYLPLYTSEQARRHDVKPGITGWAQVNGRNAIDWESKFAHDIWYVDHQSFSLDIRILWMTCVNVLRRTGISSRGHATMHEFTGSDFDA